MAKRVEGVTERLLECAKEEFLKNGYENASLRVIAEKAGSSKGAIYIRYPDKESLYYLADLKACLLKTKGNKSIPMATTDFAD